MVQRRIQYECEVCRRGFLTWEAARGCETDHFVDKAVENTRAAIKAAFAGKQKIAGQALAAPSNPS